MIKCLEDYVISKICRPHMDLTEVDMVVTTEHKRENVIFRAHPNYRGNGPWYDWAMFRYEKSDYDKKKNKTYILGDDDEVYFNDSINDPIITIMLQAKY